MSSPSFVFKASKNRKSTKNQKQNMLIYACRKIFASHHPFYDEADDDDDAAAAVRSYWINLPIILAFH